jgi:hypothetical protein
MRRYRSSANGWHTMGPLAMARTLIDQGLRGQPLRDAIASRSQRQLTLGSTAEPLPDETNRIVPDETRSDALGIPRPRINYRIDDYAKAGLALAIRRHRPSSPRTLPVVMTHPTPSVPTLEPVVVEVRRSDARFPGTFPSCSLTFDANRGDDEIVSGTHQFAPALGAMATSIAVLLLCVPAGAESPFCSLPPDPTMSWLPKTPAPNEINVPAPRPASDCQFYRPAWQRFLFATQPVQGSPAFLRYPSFEEIFQPANAISLKLKSEDLFTLRVAAKYPTTK